MSTKYAMMAVAVSVAASAMTLNAARTLVWTGAQSGNWDTSTLNWYVQGDETKTATAFESGDNVVFDDDATTKTVTLIGNNVDKFAIGTVTFNNATDYTWKANPENFTTGYFTTCGNVDKYGSGKLTIGFRSDIQGNFTCHEGWVHVTSASWWPGEYRSALGSLHNVRKETFMPGTKFSSSCSATFGGPSSGGDVTALFDGAAIDLAGSQTFRNVTFTNCTSFSVAASLSFYDKAKFLGHGATSAYVAKDSNQAFAIGTLGSATWGDITIDDVTGDGVTVDDKDDLIISNKLNGIASSGNGGWVCRLGNHFRKRGKGTMVLAGNYSPFTNDIEVVEGRMIVDGHQENLKQGFANWLYTGIGAVAGTRQRTITVDKDGIFEVRQSDVFGPLNTPQEWDLVVNGGKIVLRDNKMLEVGSLVLNNAEWEYGPGATSTWFKWGLVSIAKKLAFKGTKNYVLPYPGGTGNNTSYLTLGFTLSSQADDHAVDSGSHSHFTNLWTVVDFEVDKTASAQIDLPIRDMPNMCYPDYGTTPNGYTYDDWKVYWFRDGIRKIGEGTLKLTAQNIYTHTTEVAAGTLLVDGSINKSSEVIVNANAYIGGSGTFPKVTVADNGGFSVSATKATASATQIPSLALSGTEGIVSFRMTDASGDKSGLDGHVLLKIANKPATLDVSKWKVVGENGRKLSYVLAYNPSTGEVSATYNGGMMMLLK